MNHKLHRSIVVALTVILAAACSGVGGSGSNQQSTTPPTEISVQFSWTHSIPFSGFYVAEEQGYYDEENLSVELVAGGLNAEGEFISPVDEIVAGNADFGVVDSIILLQARAEGAPVVAIAAIYQRHPLALMSLAENGIVRPQDLVGTTVHITYNSRQIYYALLNAQGIDPSQINELERTDMTLGPIIRGEADVIDAWIVNEVPRAILDGIDFNLILPSDYGIDFYPNVIFTTEDMIANNPDLVERFLRATLRGMQSAVDDPEEAAALAVARNDTLSLESETEAMRQSLPLLKPGGSSVGMMDEETWQQAYEMLVQQNLLEEGDLEVNNAYTLVFLNRVYTQ